MSHPVSLGKLQGPEVPIEGGKTRRIGDAVHQRSVLGVVDPPKNAERQWSLMWFDSPSPTFGYIWAMDIWLGIFS